jgi:hypothetical protein
MYLFVETSLTKLQHLAITEKMCIAFCTRRKFGCTKGVGVAHTIG